jgi:MYXO-CTERM domain-containing protein
VSPTSLRPLLLAASLASPLLIVAVPRTALAASTYYISPTGSDAAAGTEAAPFASWAKAQSVAMPGDTVYFRGGTYAYTDALTTCGSPTDTVNAVLLSKSGTSGNPIRYWAYPGEHPVFDFSGISDTSKYSCRQTGVRVTGSWLYLKGIELKGTLQLNNQNHESWCVYVYGGNNNIFEMLDAHHNMGPGFFVQRGGNNLFLNCDSHENEDTLTSNGDGQSADGFGCHPDQAGNTGNLFHGCRAWWNSDDSWDFINSTEACTVEYSWAWYSGYKPDAITNGQPVALSAGNGNGFKGGGYGDPQTNVPNPTPVHVIRFDVAFYNKANGLYANHEIVNPTFYNNTSFNNGTDVDMLGLDGTTVTSVGLLRNNLAFSSNGHSLLADMTNGGPIDDQYNSWDTSLDVTVAAADFQSVAFAAPASCPQAYVAGGTPCVSPTDMTTFAGMASARQADGSLPNLPFLHLAANSPLIDKGINVGLPYAGTAPDLGAFETGEVYDPTDGGATSLPPDSGVSGSSTGSSGSTAGASTGSSGAAGSSTGASGSIDGGGSGSAGSAGRTGATSGSAATGGNAGSATGAAGSAGSGASGANTGAGGSTTGGSGATGTASHADGGAGDNGSTMPESSAGCGCRTVQGGSNEIVAMATILAMLGIGRRRRARPERTRSAP